MFKAIITFLILIFSMSSFSAVLTIRSSHRVQNVDQAPIERTSIIYGRLLLRAYHPKEGCLISKEKAEQSGYSLGELQILASMDDDTEIICITDGRNEWGDYLPMDIEVVTDN